MNGGRYTPDGLTPASCRAMRGWLHWRQDDLAARCGLSKATITGFEQGSKKGWTIGEASRRAILLAFQKAGVRVLMMDGEVRGLRFIDVAPATPVLRITGPPATPDASTG